MPLRIINSFRKYPDRNAFYINGTYYKYKDVETYVSEITGIIKIIPADEKLIGLIASDDIYTYSTIIAILLSGRAYVPLNPHHPASRNKSIIKTSGIKSIISSLDATETSKICDCDNINIYNASSLKYESETINYIANVNPDSVAYVLFTSGSTGIPKGVPITFNNLTAFCNAFFYEGYDISCEDRFLQMFDLTFDLSVMSYLIPLITGACVYTVGHSGIKYTEVYNILEEHEITFALMVPSIITSLKPYFTDIMLKKLRYSLFCGEALHIDTATEWQKCIPNASVYNVYGPTEATIFCLSYKFISDLAKDYNGIVSVGKPMKDIIAVISDESGNICKTGTKGELCLCGPQLTSGYFNMPDVTKKSFVNIKFKDKNLLFYKTGDVCYTDTDGDFMFCGRIDQQVKIQGYRIELSEIEHFVRKFSGGADAAAVTRINNHGHAEIVVFIETEHFNTSDLISYLSNTLPQYMIPSDIITIKAFPQNSNGKTDRKKLETIASY